MFRLYCKVLEILTANRAHVRALNPPPWSKTMSTELILPEEYVVNLLPSNSTTRLWSKYSRHEIGVSSSYERFNLNGRILQVNYYCKHTIILHINLVFRGGGFLKLPPSRPNLPIWDIMKSVVNCLASDSLYFFFHIS